MYTKQANVENYIGRELTVEEVLLFPIIREAVESYINEVVGGSFFDETAPNATTRYYDGGSAIIDIDPCTQITKVTSVDSEFAELSEFEVNQNYIAHPQNNSIKTWIEIRSGKFPSGYSNIAVTGKFTRGAVPSDIKYCATYLCGQFINGVINGNVKKESIEGYSVEFKEFIENDNVIKLLLDKYRVDDILIG